MNNRGVRNGSGSLERRKDFRVKIREEERRETKRQGEKRAEEK